MRAWHSSTLRGHHSSGYAPQPPLGSHAHAASGDLGINGSIFRQPRRRQKELFGASAEKFVDLGSASVSPMVHATATILARSNMYSFGAADNFNTGRPTSPRKLPPIAHVDDGRSKGSGGRSGGGGHSNSRQLHLRAMPPPSRDHAAFAYQLALGIGRRQAARERSDWHRVASRTWR